jgi:hypothetical protein
MATILHGPAASGKSHNAEAIAEAYGCNQIIDGWHPSDRKELPVNCLAIMVAGKPPNPHDKAFRLHRLVSIEEALQEIGHPEWIGRDWLAERRKPQHDPVNHPDHYGGANNPYEAIKVIEAWGLGFNLGNVAKYIARTDRKDNALEDLKKARWYLDREIQNRELAVDQRDSKES